MCIRDSNNEIVERLAKVALLERDLGDLAIACARGIALCQQGGQVMAAYLVFKPEAGPTGQFG